MAINRNQDDPLISVEQPPMEAVSSTAKSGSLPVVCDRRPGAVTRACEGRVSTSTKSSSAPLGARNFPRHETNDAMVFVKLAPVK